MCAFKLNGRVFQPLLAALLCASIAPNRLLADEKETNNPSAKAAPPKSDSPAPGLTERERQWLDLADPLDEASQEPQSQSASQQAKPDWHYGGFADLGYLLDFNHPSNHLFRNRGTTPRVNELDLNMAAIYLTKDASDKSRWGMELEAQAGEDSKIFGFSATAPHLSGANWLRQIGKADVSYLVPLGKGLTVQGGIFNSLIGYDSLYAKDNFTYTRPWGADYTPYLMFGVNASYPFSKKITATVFLINDYFHLAHPNNVPSWGGQIDYSATEHLTVKETVLYGPHQSDTSLEFWRFFSDSIAEWKRNSVTVAFEYQVGTEKVAVAANPRALWMASHLPVHWTVRGPWSMTIRPEFAWDRDARWTGFAQTIKAVTSTLEYRIPYRWTNTIARLEYRFDDSRGKGGGFFRGAEISPGVDSLTPSQHLLIFGLIFAFESH
jgi:hypothetical protein